MGGSLASNRLRPVSPLTATWPGKSRNREEWELFKLCRECVKRSESLRWVHTFCITCPTVWCIHFFECLDIRNIILSLAFCVCVCALTPPDPFSCLYSISLTCFKYPLEFEKNQITFPYNQFFAKSEWLTTFILKVKVSKYYQGLKDVKTWRHECT